MLAVAVYLLAATYVFVGAKTVITFGGRSATIRPPMTMRVLMALGWPLLAAQKIVEAIVGEDS